MATFTMQLNEVVAQMYNTTPEPEDYEQPYEAVTFGSVTYGELPVLPDEGVKLGIGGYPIFNAGYRKVLNGKILDRYWESEIGRETIDLFRLSIRRRLNEVMPYYNELYKSLETEYGPLDTMKIHSVNSSEMLNEESGLATNVSHTDNDSKSRAVNSNTPQTMLLGSEDYATGATDVNSQADVNTDSTQNNSSNGQTSSDSDTLVTGYQGAASDLMMKYRASLINIDAMILEDLQTCFMLVLNNGDAYTDQGLYYW